MDKYLKTLDILTEILLLILAYVFTWVFLMPLGNAKITSFMYFGLFVISIYSLMFIFYKKEEVTHEIQKFERLTLVFFLNLSFLMTLGIFTLMKLSINVRFIFLFYLLVLLFSMFKQTVNITLKL